MSRIRAAWNALVGRAAPAPAPITDRQNRRMIRARFDSQFTTNENKHHWKLADAMSVDASASWQVRRLLRMRNRYEYHNNGYFQNLVGNVSNYTIGTGPTLHMLTKDEQLNDAVEWLFWEWSREIGLPQILLNDRAARIYNGEAFQLLRSNPNIEHPVKLTVFEIECDQVSSPLFGMYPAHYPDQFFDGVVLDPWGKPMTYHVLRQHPGAFGAFVIMGYEFDPWPARYVLHSYKRIRPGQQRGIPETTPVLENFAQLRRYRKAVLGAAETAADMEIAIETQGAPDSTLIDDEYAGEEVEFQSGMGTVLPYGYHATQIKPEQPTTNFDMFCDSLLSEIAAVLQVPLFFLTLDARKANMSSAYVVTQPFAKTIQTDREIHYNPKMDRILSEFIRELQLISTDELQAYLKSRGYDIALPSDFREAVSFAHAWHWPNLNTHADPSKVANAQEVRLRAGVSSPQHEAAAEGRDYEEIERKIAESYGKSVEEYREARFNRDFAAPLAAPNGDKQGDEEKQGDEKTEKANTGGDDE